ncbi:MAG: GlxA family transcriptional regulator [Desulfuromonadales bacterium]|nr:GlxA family transcriptional regulator [Desulfuromonadales bacterium]
MDRFKQSIACNEATIKRKVAVLMYDGCEIIDVSGPVEAFDMANRTLTEQGRGHLGYGVSLLAKRSGLVSTSSGVRMAADGWEEGGQALDTLIIPGSPDGALSQVVQDGELLAWLKKTAPQVRRLVSVCTGAFVLAEAGFLDGRRATTHWMDTERLQRQFPGIQVEPDAIYVRDGATYSAAGVTAGIDLTLALIEEDFGRKLALAVARRMVVYLKRPGGQTQFSSCLRAQMVQDGPLSAITAWINENYRACLSVQVLAERANMSPRNFSRAFLNQTGVTPAKYVELVRMEHAVCLIEDSRKPVAAIAQECGFVSAEQMRRAFVRHLGIGPLAYRERF